jgi:hypothetical protein
VSTTLAVAQAAALRAEYRAIFAYTVLGPRLPTPSRGVARDAQTEHEARRDTLRSALAAAGTPPSPDADYPDVYPGSEAGAAFRVAADVEDGCAAAWRYVYAVLAVGDAVASVARSQAQTALTGCAVRAATWRRASGTAPVTVAFPGE